MTYDAENRLLTATAGGGGIYAYNAGGKRTRRTAGAQETWYVYGVGGELLAEYAADGAPSAPQKEYGYRGGQILIIAESGSGGGVSLVKPASKSSANISRQAGSGMDGATNRIFSADEPFINNGHDSITADSSDSDNIGTLVRGGPRVTAEKYGNAPSANGVGRELLAEYPPAAAPSAPQKEYGYRGGRSIVTVQSGGVVSVSPTANQSPDPGQGGEAVSSPLNTEHGGTLSSASRTTKGSASQTKTCLWHSFSGVTGARTRVTLKFDWTLNASVNVSADEAASADASYDFKIEYSLDNGSTWTVRRGFNDSVSIPAGTGGNDGDGIDTFGSESVDLPNPGAIDITQIRIRDRAFASASLRLSSNGSASGRATASVSNIRLEVELLDNTAPVITGVSSSAVTLNSATISWNTNEPADSQVVYGPTQAYGQSTTLNPALVTTHSQGLSGLTPGTLYYYRVKSRDAAGNLSTSAEFTFTTVPADTTAPVISNVAAGVTTTTATITWTTNENSDSQVEYGPTQAYGQSTALDTALVTAHSQGLSGLTPGTLYYYRVKSRDAAGNLTTSAEFTFTTAQNGSGGIKWLVTDHLGSTRMVIDETGNLERIKRHDFCPFGEELSAGVGIRSASLGYGDDSIRQKFTGYERDGETDLDFAEARYFSSKQGRFTSTDPLLDSAEPYQPQSWNRYAYVLNNPLLYIDPTGMIWVQNNQDKRYYWIPDDKWEEASKLTFNNGQQLYTPLRQDQFEYDSDQGRVVLDPRGPTAENPNGYTITQQMSRAGILAVGALGVSQIDSPAPGPGDAVAVGILLYAGYVWMTQKTLPLPIVDPNIFTQGDRDARKINQKRLDALQKQLDQLKEQLANASRKPNKTPEDKDLIEKIKRAINKVIDAMKKSETHGRTGKGN